MAIIKHISVKNRFYSDAVEYLTCKFDEYTNKSILDEKGRVQERDSYLIEGVNCNADTFGAECIETNRLYGKNNSIKDVKAHHYIISFDPTDNITMEQAMEFGKQWLEVFVPGYQAVLAVHPDGHNGSQNMHVHIVINSVRKYECKKEKWHDKPCEWKQGCKHKSTGKMMYHAKKWVMRQCLLLGYGQVDLLTKKHTDNYWVEKRLMDKNVTEGVGITSNKELIRNTIDKLLLSVDSFEQLLEFLQGIYDWNIRVTDKTVTFATPNMKKGIRGNKLGEGYGKAELVERIEHVVAERKAEQEARRIAEEKERAKAEVAAKEEEVRKAKQIEEERKQKEILSRKRKLAFERNNIQHQYYSEELNRPDWNREYTAYLNTQFISDYAAFSEEELTAPIMTREEFEARQAVNLYRVKAEKAGLIWEETLSGITSVTHRWKWEYMDYLEAIRFKDVGSVTLQEAKEAILTYEEFAELKELEVKKKDPEQVVDDSNQFVNENTVDTEITEQPVFEADIVPKVESTLEDVSAIPEETIDGKTTEKDIESEPVDFKKLSIKERAELLSEPTDDIMTEFNAYCKRMGYTEEKVRSIRYKMSLYDEFMEEYNYRYRNCKKKDAVLPSRNKRYRHER